MKQYLLSVHYVDGAPATPPEEAQQAYERVDAFNQQVMASGAWVFGGGLFPPDLATVVKATADEVTTTDGPFAEAKEQLGGFWVLKAPDLDAALKLAEQASLACGGPVEVRPFQDEAD